MLELVTMQKDKISTNNGIHQNKHTSTWLMSSTTFALHHHHHHLDSWVRMNQGHRSRQDSMRAKYRATMARKLPILACVDLASIAANPILFVWCVSFANTGRYSRDENCRADRLPHLALWSLDENHINSIGAERMSIWYDENILAKRRQQTCRDLEPQRRLPWATRQRHWHLPYATFP